MVRPSSPPSFRLKAVLVLVAVVAFVVSPIWSPSFKGYDPTQFPNPVDAPAIQPAGWAFSIWSLIYLWLVAHALWGLLRHNDDAGWDRTRLPLLLSTGLGASWLVVATSMPWLATLQIWLMWALALWAMMRARDAGQPALCAGPIGLYTGWLTAASAVGTGVVLIGYNIGSEITVTLLMLCVVAAISLAIVLLARPPRTFAIAVIWALIGVIAANWGDGVVMLPASIFALALAAVAWRDLLPKAQAVGR
ncbi:hypothetical protein [Thioclava kandeliae]|uniref:Tryptophan-rich sensory protein n=1 Tax=Thioclava kandeliae TaxID=3070818 RepID=A0ABV1SHP6_9RHOB